MRITAEKIRQKLRNTMTVAALIEELGHLDPAALVVYQSDYGDYNHTQQVTPVRTVDAYDPEIQRLVDSGYSRSGVAVDELDEPDEGDELEEHDHAELAVVILS